MAICYSIQKQEQELLRCWDEMKVLIKAKEEDDIKVELDQNLRIDQLEAVKTIAALHKISLGALLADPVGAGKTVISIGVAKHVHDCQPSSQTKQKITLIIVPTRLKNNWIKEMNKFWAECNLVVVDDTKASKVCFIESFFQPIK